MTLQKRGTSRPKARDGLRYPCPVKSFGHGSLLVSRAAAPKGLSPIEHRGNLYVHASSRIEGLIQSCAIEEFLVSRQGLPEDFYGFQEGGLGIPDTLLHCQETFMGLL